MNLSIAAILTPWLFAAVVTVLWWPRMSGADIALTILVFLAQARLPGRLR